MTRRHGTPDIGAAGPSYLEPNRFSGTARNVSATADKLNVKFSNPDLANSKVTIIIHDGFEKEKTLVIPLDGKGKGEAEFPIPQDWTQAVLTHPTSVAHPVNIGGP